MLVEITSNNKHDVYITVIEIFLVIWWREVREMLTVLEEMAKIKKINLGVTKN